jgi:hypothetical protein
LIVESAHPDPTRFTYAAPETILPAAEGFWNTFPLESVIALGRVNMVVPDVRTDSYPISFPTDVSTVDKPFSAAILADLLTYLALILSNPPDISYCLRYALVAKGSPATVLTKLPRAALKVVNYSSESNLLSPETRALTSSVTYFF